MIIKKTSWSFRVSVTDGRTSVNSPWPRPHTRHLHDFKPHLERYRRRRRVGISLLVGFMILGFLMTWVRAFDRVGIWGFGALTTLWLLGVIVVFSAKLRCPACGKKLEPARGPYCPLCGSDAFNRGRNKRGPLFGRKPYCPSCDQRIEEASGEESRSYRIRGCTHCGVMLDENGV